MDFLCSIKTINVFTPANICHSRKTGRTDFRTDGSQVFTFNFSRSDKIKLRLLIIRCLLALYCQSGFSLCSSVFLVVSLSLNLLYYLYPAPTAEISRFNCGTRRRLLLRRDTSNCPHTHIYTHASTTHLSFCSPSCHTCTHIHTQGITHSEKGRVNKMPC